MLVPVPEPVFSTFIKMTLCCFLLFLFHFHYYLLQNENCFSSTVPHFPIILLYAVENICITIVAFSKDFFHIFSAFLRLPFKSWECAFFCSMVDSHELLVVMNYFKGYVFNEITREFSFTIIKNFNIKFYFLQNCSRVCYSIVAS